MNTVVFDSNYVANVAKYSFAGLSTGIQETGVIYGFMLQIIACAKLFETNRFAFVWDSRQSKRREFYPAYKLNRLERKRTPEEEAYDLLCFNQFHLLRDTVLKKLGFKNVFHFEGYEGDDLIASIVFKNHPTTNLIVVATDSDLYQLLDCCSLFSITKKHLITKRWFMTQYGIEPVEWSKIKAIGGCQGDGVPGISGVGMTTALKYVKGELKPNSRAYKKIEAGREDIDFVYKPLVTLPYQGTPEITLIKNERFLSENFLRVCEEYDFISIIKDYSTWNQYFQFR